jgi:hypothetical protein
MILKFPEIYKESGEKSGADYLIRGWACPQDFGVISHKHPFRLHTGEGRYAASAKRLKP